MPEPLPDDIIERIRQDFAPHEADEAIRLLTEGNWHGRMARCITFLAKGNLDELKRYIESAKLDYRDVISWAEYDRGGVFLRDLVCSFLVEGKENFWIIDVSHMLLARGYRLTGLESRRSRMAKNRVKATSDYEGVATFVNNADTIMIRLQDRKWTLIDDSADLGVYGLDVPSDDSSWFHEAVSRFTAMKARGLHVRRVSG